MWCDASLRLPFRGVGQETSYFLQGQVVASREETGFLCLTSPPERRTRSQSLLGTKPIAA